MRYHLLQRTPNPGEPAGCSCDPMCREYSFHFLTLNELGPGHPYHLVFDSDRGRPVTSGMTLIRFESIACLHAKLILKIAKKAGKKTIFAWGYRVMETQTAESLRMCEHITQLLGLTQCYRKSQANLAGILINWALLWLQS